MRSRGSAPPPEAVRAAARHVRTLERERLWRFNGRGQTAPTIGASLRITDERARASTRTSKRIRAHPALVCEACLDPAARVDWLPPAAMTGKIHEFEARVGGGHRMPLYYPPHERAFRGKTSATEDVVNAGFVDLPAPRRIVEAVSVVTTRPALFAAMTLTATCDEMSGGTQVTRLCQRLPSGLRPEDNKAGLRLSLEQLARRFG